MINCGIIGLGVGEQHIKKLSTVDNVKIIAVCDYDKSKLDRICSNFEISQRYFDWKQMLEIDNLDMVVISSYDQDHAEQVISCLNRNLHVFVEKPLCLTQVELNEIRKSMNKISLIGCNLILRKEKRFSRLKERIANGELGEIYSIEGSYDYGRLWKITDGWRSKTENYSITLGGGIHLVDLCQWLTNGCFVPEYTIQNKVSSKFSNFKGADFSTTLGRIDENIIFKISSNFGSQTPHFHQLKVYGTKGTFIHDCGVAKYYFNSEPNVSTELDNTEFPQSEKGDMLPEFIGAVAGEGELEFGAEQIFALTETCLAIDKLGQK